MNEPNKQNSNVSQFNRYLDNNTDILKQKFKEHYNEPFPSSLLTHQPNLENTLHYIYDIFNFSKYEANEELNKTLRNSLIQNITTFSKKYKQGTYDPQMAVLMLKYCIEHNDMFAVHYDKKRKNQIVTQEDNNESQLKKSSSQIKLSQLQLQQKVLQEEKQAQNIEQKSVQNEQIGLSNQQHTRYLEESKINQINEFQSPPEKQKQQNLELIRKQLKDVFQFYCKQQQNVGPNFTFDNISHKCQTMNLGKFMTFAKTANIVHSKDKLYSEGKIQKNQLVSAFKKAAKGQRQIDFQIFMIILDQLKKEDPTIYEKLGLGQQGTKGKNKLLQKLKYLNLPFNTRDPHGREASPFGRVFVPKLTTHSGKYEESLREELNSRKLRLSKDQQGARISSKLSIQSRVRMEQKKNQEISRFKLKLGESNNNLDNSDLNFLSKIITQQENDDVFLKDYIIPNNKKYHKGSQQYNRYQQQGADLGKNRQFYHKIGGYTSRPKKVESFVLPSITKRGGQTQNNSIRRSMDTSRKIGSRLNQH